ncbi:MAG: hypothetical protein K2X39_08060 [Silvanigrellaceae bacterium]|nr:hypothetical protein [Silvanigrellaceae bacterium]
MLRIGIISNPFSKINKQNPDYNTQLWYTLSNIGQFVVTRNLDELSKTCREFKARKIDLIGIVGGDGSMSVVLSAIFKAYGHENLPRILVLKGGTINFLAQNLGINRPALECLEDFVTHISKDQPIFETRFSTLKIGERIGFIFANGIAVRFLEEFYKNKTNSLGALYLIGKSLADGALKGKLSGLYPKIVQEETMQIKTRYPNTNSDDKNNYGTYTMVLASTVPKIPYGIHLFKKIDNQTQHGELISISLKGKDLVKNAFKAALLKDLNGQGMQSELFQNATIYCKKNSSYSLDGEVLETEGQIDLQLGPQFTFCSPYRSILG